MHWLPLSLGVPVGASNFGHARPNLIAVEIFDISSDLKKKTIYLAMIAEEIEEGSNDLILAASIIKDTSKVITAVAEEIKYYS